MAHVLARVAGVGACSVMLACSSSPAATAGPGSEADGGGEASSGPVGDGSVQSDASGPGIPEDASTVPTTCTAPPFVTFTGVLSVLDVGGATQPLSGGTIEFSTCTGFKITTDATGTASAQITEGVPVSPVYFGGLNVIAGIGAEISPTSSVSVSPTLFAFDVTPSIPGFAEDGGNAATIAIAIQVDPAATAPCNVTSGVALAVTGHPEAIVSYASAAWPGNPTVTTTSSTGPYAFINGVSASRLSVVGSKPGCTVNLATASQTGDFILVAGSVTSGVAVVTN